MFSSGTHVCRVQPSGALGSLKESRLALCYNTFVQMSDAKRSNLSPDACYPFAEGRRQLCFLGCSGPSNMERSRRAGHTVLSAYTRPLLIDAQPV